MTIKVEFDTFNATETQGDKEIGTVNITIGKMAVTVSAVRYIDRPNDLWLKGFVGRYRTSPKAWRASVCMSRDGREFVTFGRDDRSGRFNKMSMITYEPEIYASL